MKQIELPISSVIEAKGHTLLVVGYSAQPVQGKQTQGYICVELPFGFMNSESMGFVSCADVEKVLFDGYKTDVSNAFTANLARFYQTYDELGEETAQTVLKDFLEFVERETEEDEAWI